MPRGGGGGGFRGGGGGFSGGGFRSSGFRGGSSFRGSSFRSTSFRSSSYHSNPRPFGRTGATRTRVNTRPSTHRNSGYYHRPYYRRHYYHRPYYYHRWWYRPWWAGHYYRPWYYSPGIMFGGFFTFLMFLLILLPLFGLAFAFPFSGSTNDGVINYRSTEVLYYNEYWYEYEQVNADGKIEFEIASSNPNAGVSFAIANHEFDAFGSSDVSGSFSYSRTLEGGVEDFEMYQIYLKAGSTVTYTFEASEDLVFFIADGEMVYNWYVGENPIMLFEQYTDTLTNNYFIDITQDYYLVWYNPSAIAIDLNYSINYNAADIIEYSSAIPESVFVDETFIEGSVDIDSSGTYYFFVYFDPFYSIEESTTITFDVTYYTNVSNSQRWTNARPWLIFFTIIGVILLITAIRGRSKQKELNKKKAKDSTTEAAQKIATKTQQTIYGQKKESTIQPTSPMKKATHGKCIFCNSSISDNAIFCPNCGRKQEGRVMGTIPITTPAQSKICSFCGRKLDPGTKFCPDCGVKIEE